MSNKPAHFLPFKSAAVALLFSVLLGPVGLLYSSLWGGSLMIMLATIALSSRLYFASLIIWVACSVWSVAAVEKYNRILMQS